MVISRRNLKTGAIEFARVIRNFNPFENVYPHYFTWHVNFNNGTHFPNDVRLVESLIKNERDSNIIYEGLNDDGTELAPVSD